MWIKIIIWMKTTNNNESTRNKCGQVMVWVVKTCQTMSMSGLIWKTRTGNCESQVESKKLGQAMSIAGWFEKVSQWHMQWHMRRMILNPIDYEPDCWLLDTHQCKLGYISTHQCKLVHTSTHQYPSVHISIQEHTTAGPCAAYVICAGHMRAYVICAPD